MPVPDDRADAQQREVERAQHALQARVAGRLGLQVG
jgi:hypothetical protein